MNALYFFIATAVAGLALACAGTWVLAGTGWALIAGAASMLIIAAFIRRGLTSG